MKTIGLREATGDGHTEVEHGPGLPLLPRAIIFAEFRIGTLETTAKLRRGPHDRSGLCPI